MDLHTRVQLGAFFWERQGEGGAGGRGGGLFVGSMLKEVPHRQIILDDICQMLGPFLANWIVP